MATMNIGAGLALLMGCVLLAACAHSMTMRSRDGETLLGRYRFGREGQGLMQITTSQGEVLHGTFAPVHRTAFVNGYEKAFGRGSIDWDGPDLSAAGNVFLGLFGNSYALSESASGEKFNAPGNQSTTVITGPLFYWTAFLEGDKRSSMRCYLIGSAHTGSGFGRCMGHQGKEYSVEF
jgi:hypothetical protein